MRDGYRLLTIYNIMKNIFIVMASITVATVGVFNLNLVNNNEDKSL